MPTRSARRAAMLAVVSLAAGALVASAGAAPALAVPNASISGVVTGQTGALEHVTVSAYTSYGDYLAEADTNASGAFTIANVVPGSYTLKFDPTDDDAYAPEYLGDSYLLASAAYFPVTAGATITGKNAQLGAGATIAGNLKGNGTNLQIACVTAYSAEWGEVGCTAPSSSGNFVVRGLAPGSYTLHAQAISPWAAGYFGNVPSLDAATFFTVAAAQHVTGKNIVLPLSSTVSGTVSAVGGGAVNDVDVTVTTLDGEYAGYDTTDSSGNYSVTGLAGGQYVLEFWPYSTNHVKEYNNDAVLRADADPVTVPVSTTVAAVVTVNAQLAVGATISGTVTDNTALAANHVTVDAFTPAGEFLNEVETDASGNYAMTGLPAGDIRLLFYPDNTGLAQEWWSDAASMATSSGITVTAGATLTGYNVQLAAAARISGRVVGPDGEAPPASVALYGAGGSGDGVSTIVDVVSTDSSGAYVFPQLKPGSYVVGAAAFAASAADPLTAAFQPSSGGYISAWFGQALSYASASVVTLPAGTAPYAISDIVLGNPTFADVSDPGSLFYESIEWMAAEGISTGTQQPKGKPLFKPADTVSRLAMAAFLYRASGETFTPPATATFADVPVGSQLFTEIEWMASKGISTGTPQPTGKPLYKPADPVSRQAMALFLARYSGADLTVAPTEPTFADVPVTSEPAAAIQWMFTAGVSTGTAQPSGLPLYKPADAVSRQAMSLFLFRLP